MGERIDMRRKIITILLTIMMCLTAIVIVPVNNYVKADVGSGGNFELDNAFIHTVTENLSNVIYNVYNDSELHKGRAFGSKGEHWSADYLESVMQEIGLTNVEKERIQNIPEDVTVLPARAGDRNLTVKLDVLQEGHIVNNSGSKTQTDCYISPLWNNSKNDTSYDKNLLTYNFSFGNLKVVKTENYTCTDDFLRNVTLGPLNVPLIWENIPYFNNLQDVRLTLDIPGAMEKAFQDSYNFRFDTINSSDPNTFPSFLKNEPVPQGNFTFIEECPKNNPNIQIIPTLENHENFNSLYLWSFVVRNAYLDLKMKAWYKAYPNCKGLIWFDYTNESYDTGNEGTYFPIIYINGTIGKQINASVNSYSIDYYVNQQWNTSVESYNVIGQITGQDPSQTVICGVLYDSVWSEGTVDSAIGVGIMLAIAKYMKELETNYDITPKYTVKFVAYGGEEDGMLGAYYYEATHLDENIITVIDLNQVGYNQTSPSSIFNIITNKIFQSFRLNNAGEKVNYQIRTGGTTELRTLLIADGSLSDSTVFAQAALPWIFGGHGFTNLNTTLFLKDTGWFRHHRDGMNHTEGDSMKYVDWNDVNVTSELIWNITRYYTINPDCYFQTTPTYTLHDSPDDINTDPDSINITYTINTSMPQDHVKVRAIINPVFTLEHPLYPILYRYTNTSEYVITNTQEITDTLTIQLPKSAPKGEYQLHVYLYNSTGEINNILDNENDLGIYANEKYEPDPFFMRPPNDPPMTPPMPSGATDVMRFIENPYTAYTYDPNGDQIYYQFDWRADKIIPELSTWQTWEPSYDQNQTCTRWHGWILPDTYEIRVRARDQWLSPNDFSEWSEPLTVTVHRWIDGSGWCSACDGNQACCNSKWWCYWHPDKQICRSWPPGDGGGGGGGGPPGYSMLIQYSTTTVVDKPVQSQSTQYQTDQTGKDLCEWNWTWDWNDGNTSYGPNPSHSYSQIGNYTINLTITDCDQETMNMSLPISIRIIKADFNPNKNSAKPNETIYFNDTSQGKYSLTEYTWNFGDGNYSTAQNPTHIYTTPGVYNVTLTVLDSQNNNNTTSQQFHIESVPPDLLTATYTPNPIGFGSPMTIYADFYDNQSGIQTAKINLTYPDGSTKNLTMQPSNNSYDYEDVFTDTWQGGQYDFAIYVEDTAGNTNYYTGFSFTVTPIFGYTPTGEFNTSIQDNITGSVFTINEYGTAENITAYLQPNFTISTAKAKCMIYQANDLLLIGTSDEVTMEKDTNSSWVTFNFSDPKPDLEKNTEYILTCYSDENVLFSYDDSITSDGRYNNTISYGSPPEYINFTDINRTYSLYCGYTPQDTTPPEITNVFNTPDTVRFGNPVIISVNASDNMSGIGWIKTNIIYPDNSTGNYTMNNIGENTYRYVFSDTQQSGEYTYNIWAYDNCSNNNGNSSSGHDFRVNYPPDIVNLFPNDEATDVGLYPFLSVSVNDADNDVLNVTFINASANISTTHVVTNGNGLYEYTTDVYAVDIDNDNDMDILSTNMNNSRIIWWKNNGNQVFTPYTISSNFSSPQSVYAADIDDDGNIDVVSASLYSDQVAWWKNNGDGTFSGIHIIDNTFDGACSVYATDVDLDGNIDVLGAGKYANEIAWWKNNGDGTFSSRNVIDDDFFGAYSVYAVDVDSDCDVDVLGAGTYANEIAWWENNGDEVFTKHVLDNDFDNASDVFAADIDSNGRIDIIGSAWGDNEIAWWENEGNKMFTKHVIDSSCFAAKAIYACDVDSDGDVDVLGAEWGPYSPYTSGQILWWENNGDESFTKQVISDSCNRAYAVYAADVDSDGDIDVLGGAWYHAKDYDIAWFENHMAIDQNLDVSSGSIVKYQWNDLALDTTYLWRVSVSDGKDVVSSPVWNFTTADDYYFEILNVNHDPSVVGFGFNVTLSADVLDVDGGLQTITANITYPNSTITSYPMTHLYGQTYEYIFTNTWQHGQYNYTIWAVNNSGGHDTSQIHSFNVSANATISICTIKDSYGDDEPLNLTDPPGDDDPSVDVPDAKPQSDEWYVTERGPTWIKYRNGTKPEYKIQTYGDLINYKDEAGIYREINISNLTISVDGSYILNSTPYLFTLDSTRRFMTIYPDRNNKDRYVEMYMPSSFTMNSRPFWQNAPSIINADAGMIQWTSPNYDIQLRFDSSRLFFEIVLKNSLAATNTFNMTIIPHNMSYSDLNWINMLTDANDVTRPLTVTYNETTHILDVSINTVGLAYPITVDPSMQFYGLSQDCHIYSANTNYSTAWTATSGTIANSTTNTVGQTKVGTTYTIYRDPVYFNTTTWSLPALATLTGISLHIYCTSFPSNTVVVIQNGQPLYPENPPVAFDYNKANYSGDGGSAVGAGISNLWASIPLNATGQTWINYAGVTKLMLRSANDINDVAPTSTERWICRSVDYSGTTYDPYLEFTYEYYVETSVDTLPSNVYDNPHNVTVTGASGYDNVSLLYRVSNRTFAMCADTGDASIQYESDEYYGDYQTFYVPYDCYFSNLSMWMKKDVSVANYFVDFVECNATGCPIGASIGLSGSSSDADMGTDYGWVKVEQDTPIFFKGGKTYGFGISPNPYGHIWVAYNSSQDYDYTGGSRWYLGTPPVEYPKEDFLFKINYSWVLWNDTSNPDTMTPWSFPFNFPDGNGVYEFRSLGCYLGFYENYSYNNETWCHYQIQSKIKNTGSTDIKGYLLIQVQYNNSGVWIVDNDTINETTPRTIIHGDQLPLDQIFNGLVNTNDLQNGNGTYRVYAAFRDPAGNVLVNDDDQELAAWYEFEVTGT